MSNHLSSGVGERSEQRSKADARFSNSRPVANRWEREVCVAVLTLIISVKDPRFSNLGGRLSNWWGRRYIQERVVWESRKAERRTKKRWWEVAHMLNAVT